MTVYKIKEQRKKMKKNSVIDDDLANVNGGTSKQIADLKAAIKIPYANVFQLEMILRDHGILAFHYDGHDERNRYTNRETGEAILHEDLIKMIKENDW